MPPIYLFWCLFFGAVLVVLHARGTVSGASRGRHFCGQFAPQVVRGIWKSTGNGINPPGTGKALEFHYSEALCPRKASKTMATGDKTTAASSAEVSVRQTHAHTVLDGVGQAQEHSGSSCKTVAF